MSKHYEGRDPGLVLLRMWTSGLTGQWVIGAFAALMLLLTTGAPSGGGWSGLVMSTFEAREPWSSMRIQDLSGHLGLVSALLVTIAFSGTLPGRRSLVGKQLLRVTLVVSRLLGIAIAFVLTIEALQRTNTAATIVMDASLALLATGLIAVGDLVDDGLLRRRIEFLEARASVAAGWKGGPGEGKRTVPAARLAGWGTLSALTCVLGGLAVAAIGSRFEPARAPSGEALPLPIVLAAALLVPLVVISLYVLAAVRRWSEPRVSPASTGHIASGITFALSVLLIATTGSISGAALWAAYLLLPWWWTRNSAIAAVVGPPSPPGQPRALSVFLRRLHPAGHLRSALAVLIWRRRYAAAKAIERELVDARRLASAESSAMRKPTSGRRSQVPR